MRQLGHVRPTDRMQREKCWCLDFHLLFIQSGTLVYEIVLLTFRVILPTLYNPI